MPRDRYLCCLVMQHASCFEEMPFWQLAEGPLPSQPLPDACESSQGGFSQPHMEATATHLLDTVVPLTSTSAGLAPRPFMGPGMIVELTMAPQRRQETHLVGRHWQHRSCCAVCCTLPAGGTLEWQLAEGSSMLSVYLMRQGFPWPQKIQAAGDIATVAPLPAKSQCRGIDPTWVLYPNAQNLLCKPEEVAPL